MGVVCHGGIQVSYGVHCQGGGTGPLWVGSAKGCQDPYGVQVPYGGALPKGGQVPYGGALP